MTPGKRFVTEKKDPWPQMQKRQVSWGHIVFNGEGQGFDYFPEAEKIKWQSNSDTIEKGQEGQVGTSRRAE